MRCSIRCAAVSALVIALGVATTLARESDEDIRRAYVGNTYMRLPERSFGGWSVSDNLAVAHVAHFDAEMLWLEVIDRGKDAKRLVYRVVDILVFPKDYKASGLELDPCQVRAAKNLPAVVALVKQGTHVEVRAWKVDIEQQRFVELDSPEGTCRFIPGDD